MEKILESLEPLARSMAGVRDPRAPIYFFTGAAIKVRNNLTVGEAIITPRVPKTLAGSPLIFAQLAQGPGSGHDVIVERVYVITPELWLQRHNTLSIAYSAATRNYTFVLSELPKGTPLPVDSGAPFFSPPKSTSDVSSCQHLYQRQVFITWRDVEKAMKSPAAPGAERGLAAMLECLEIMGHMMQLGKESYPRAQERMRFASMEYHAPLFIGPDAHEVRMKETVSLLLGIILPLLQKGAHQPDTKNKVSPPKSLVDMAGDRACHPVARAWVRAEEAMLKHRMSDPLVGAAHCATCSNAVVQDLHEAINAQATLHPGGCPSWISALLERETTSGSYVTGTLVNMTDGSVCYRISRALGYRLPIHLDRTEDPATGSIVVSAETFLYGIVPMVNTWLCLDALWYAHVSRGNSVAEASELLLSQQDSLGKAIGSYDSDSLSALSECRVAIEPEEVTRVRIEHPFPESSKMEQGTSFVNSAFDMDQMAAWFAMLDKGRERVAASLGDIEDLVRSDLMPPCMKNAVEHAREKGHLDSHARLTLGSWLAVMGVDTSSALKLVTNGGAGSGPWVKDFANTHAGRLRKKGEANASLSCKANINNVSGERVCACPFRADPELNITTSGKITDAADLRRIRRACSETLPDYERSVWPPFSVSHPVDYIQLRMHSLDIKRLPFSNGDPIKDEASAVVVKE